MEKLSTRERINDKIIEIEKYLENLSSYIPNSLEEYKESPKTKDACEHCFEKIVEASEDLAFLLLKFEKIKFPEKEESIFNVLVKSNIINNELSKKLQDAKGMRNFISHEYGKVDDEIVFEAISNELEVDIRKFIKEILNYINHG